MQRRQFLEQASIYPLALRQAKAAVVPPQAVFRGVGEQRQVMDLSGTWELRMDPANRGLDRAWFKTEPSGTEAKAIRVEVPSVWQQYIDQDGGIVWYFKTFSLPKEIQGRGLRLRFRAVDYRARVWLNGEYVGMHEGGFTPFEFDIRHASRVGGNLLVVRVSDVGRDFRPHYCGLPGWERPTWESVDGIYFDEIPAGFQDWREGFNHSGIWQPVELVAHDLVYVQDAFILPNVARGAIEARIEITNLTDTVLDARLGLELKPWKKAADSGGSTERRLRLEPGSNAVTMPAEIRQPRAWSPDDPFLYNAEVSIHQGPRRRDDVIVRFRLRELTVGEDGYFRLNGKRTFLKGAHRTRDFGCG